MPPENRAADDKQRPPSLIIDDRQAHATYANVCRLSGLPEELLIDFGLNLQAVQQRTDELEFSQRIVTGWHTAKRLQQTLQIAVSRHEANFGFVETDVQKRIDP